MRKEPIAQQVQRYGKRDSKTISLVLEDSDHLDVQPVVYNDNSGPLDSMGSGVSTLDCNVVQSLKVSGKDSIEPATVSVS